MTQSLFSLYGSVEVVIYDVISINCKSDDTANIDVKIYTLDLFGSN